MAGFETIRKARTTLISMEEHILAPCPHQGPCPMTENDRCHFAERVERTSLHRKMKEGTLGYEDEKYSSVILFPFFLSYLFCNINDAIKIAAAQKSIRTTPSLFHMKQ